MFCRFVFNSCMLAEAQVSHQNIFNSSNSNCLLFYFCRTLVMTFYKTPTLHFLPNQPAYLSVFPLQKIPELHTSVSRILPQPPLFSHSDVGLPSGGTRKALLVWTYPKLYKHGFSGFQSIIITYRNPISSLQWK